jgi:hypothetical protein
MRKKLNIFGAYVKSRSLLALDQKTLCCILYILCRMQWETAPLISNNNNYELLQVLYTSTERHRKYIELSFVKTDIFINRYKALIVKFSGLGPEGEMSIGGGGERAH